jgi:hypothetical protein
MGGLTGPVEAPVTAGSLLAHCDPFLASALPYWQHVINHYLSRAYVAALAWQGTPATEQACVDTLPLDPAPYLAPILLRLPFLACYPVSGRGGERTLHKSKTNALYRIVYALPSGLTLDQHRRLHPILRAAVDLLTLACDEGGLDSYQSGERIWATAGVDRVAITAWTIGAYAEGETLTGVIPALQADVEIESSERWDSASALPFWAETLTLTTTDDAGDEATLVEAETTIL